eukprot:scaffold7731_cov267-Pinguiococcus_pyrenoidosus.AAC.3
MTECTMESLVEQLCVGRCVLAPMVRAGTLPLRLLALSYGASGVWSEEIVDHKLMTCQRVENPRVGTVDFVLPDAKGVVFRTCAAETSRLVLQLGTGNDLRAQRAAELCCGDVSAVEVNMGCPKRF